MTTSSSTCRWPPARRCATRRRACAGSSMVTAMARNGVTFGVRLSGTGDAWFEAPANPVDGLYFPGYSIADAAADLGDSAITETAGVGGFAMAAAPAIVKFVGGTSADAIHHSLRMRAITLGAIRHSRCPRSTSRRPPPASTRARSSTAGVLPVINSGIAHREAGVGQIGAGVTTAPMACFTAAVKALARSLASCGSYMSPPPAARRWGSLRVAGRRGAPRVHHPPEPSAAVAVSAATHRGLDDGAHGARRRIRTPVMRNCPHVAAMVSAGWNVVLTHGNGPQVGFILRRSEIADGTGADGPGAVRGRRYAGCDRLHVPECARQCAVASWRPHSGVVTLVTQTLVDRRDPAFAKPDKPIGSFMTEAVALAPGRRAGLDGDAGRQSRLAARDRVYRSRCG